jgi:hypothetical protein
MKIHPIILAGSEFEAPVEKLAERPILVLPIRDGMTLIEFWSELIFDAMPVGRRISLLFNSSRGFQSMEHLSGNSRFERHIDPRSNRGTAGVIADHWKGLPAEDRDVDYIVVIDRSTCPPHSLERFAVAISEDADVVIGVSELDRLAGIIAIKPVVLEFVPDIGYFDLKEQAFQAAFNAGLKVIAASVIPRALRLNTIKGWIDSVRFHAFHSSDEDSRRTIRGSCIDPDADVRNAAIIDSVVMKNVLIHDDVVVARSIICEGVEIPAGARVVDSVVTRESQLESRRFVTEARST